MVATMNPNGSATSGRATGVAVGTSLLPQPLGSQAGSTTLTVTAALANNPTAPELGETERFVILASQAITTTSGSAISNGDLGIMDQARSFYAGFTIGATAGQFVELTNGLSYAPDDVTPPYVIPVPYASTVAFINQVRTDLGIAYTFLAADPNPGAPTQVCPIELGNQTLTRGVYKTASNVTIQTGNLTLDAEGMPIPSGFSPSAARLPPAPREEASISSAVRKRRMSIGERPEQRLSERIRSSAGNVFAWPQINVTTGADVTGRLFSVTEQVTLDANTVTAPRKAESLENGRGRQFACLFLTVKSLQQEVSNDFNAFSFQNNHWGVIHRSHTLPFPGQSGNQGGKFGN